ncbi:RNA polymerase sigma factor [Solihabitans fulvus]|uniref:RNA polymerase sigma factor n=1 Tax=Solihabitans fulvus TaxID=1892852 RepID=UPI001CB75DDF|nr:sigma-70 family RNA polymerase sigma factor [Solihabitans fulvus]
MLGSGGTSLSGPEIEDAALSARTALGDVAAFELLLRRYQDRVFGMSLRMLGDHGEAEDASQEVFVTAWRRMSELSDPGAVRTWLFRIAHRHCLGVLRKRRDHRTYPTDDLSGVDGKSMVDGWTDPQRATEAGAGVRALRVALRQLPPAQRAVWLLAEVDGLSYAEIAELVGTGEQAVRGRLSRARTRLAESMRVWR